MSDAEGAFERSGLGQLEIRTDKGVEMRVVGLLLGVVALMLVSSPVVALDFSGTCSGTVPAAGSPHRLVGSCSVSSGTSWTFEAGATLEGQGNSLSVYGTVVADQATIENTYIRVYNGGDFQADQATLSGASSDLDFYFGSSGSVTNSMVRDGSGCRISIDDSSPTIDGNTFVDVSNAICVGGSTTPAPAGPSIQNNDITATWRGIDYNTGTIGGTVHGNTIGFSGTSSGRIAIELDSSVSPVVDGNTILDDPLQDDTAIDIALSHQSTVVVTNNDLCVTGNDVPIRLDLAVLDDASPANISGNVFSCGIGAGFTVYSSNLTQNTTLAALNGQTVFGLSSTINVQAGATFTVGTGVTLVGQHLSIWGNLNANGAIFDGIDVDFYDGSGGTVENSQLTDASPVYLSGNSVLDPAAPTLLNNTIVATATAVDVNGTAAPMLVGNTITTNSRGLSYAGTSAGTATGNQIAFVPEGGSSRVAIEIESGASPVVDDNMVHDDPTRDDVGIEVDVSAASATQVTNNSVCATGGDEPLRIDPGFFADGSAATISGNTFDCGLASGLTLLGSTVAANSTVTAVNGQTSFTLASSVTVNENQALTLASGLTFVGGGGFNVYGDLDANGVIFDDIYVNYYDRSGGVLENSSVSQSSPIYLSGSLVTDPPAPTLRNNTIVASSTAIDVNGTAAPMLVGNTITTNSRGLSYSGTSAGTATGNQIVFVPEGSNSRRGIEIRNAASPVVDGNMVHDDPTRRDFGVEIDVTADSATQVINNSLCATADDEPLRISPGIFAAGSTASISGNLFDCGLGAGITLLGSTVASNSTVTAVNGQSSFNLSSVVTVNTDQVLTLASGLIFAGGGGFNVYGDLDADGVTLDDVEVNYYDGSGGVLENSVLTESSPIYLSGSSVIDPPAPVLRNNSITSSSVAINVNGTARPTIEGNTIRTNSVAIDYASTTGGTASGNTIEFEPEGSSNRRGIDLRNEASPVLDGNTVLDDPTRDDFGISVGISQASSAQVINNTICATGGDTPLRLSVDAFVDGSPSVISGNVFDCGLARGLALEGTLDADATVGPLEGQGAFRLSSTLSVPAGLRLAIQPGVDLDGDFHTLQVDGTLELDQVSLRDTYVRFRSGSDGTLTDSVFVGPGYTTGIELTGASAVLTGNHFTAFSTAVQLYGGSDVVMISNLFEANTTAIGISSPDALSTVGMNQFVANTDSLRFGNADSLFSAFPTDFSTNTFSGPLGSNLVWLPNPWDVSGILPASPVPYKNTHSLSLTNGSQVTIQAGAVIASTSFRTITAEPGTRLLALGTPEFPVVFTDFDHTDTTRWSGLRLRDDDSILQGCVIELSSGDGLRLENASVAVTDCVLNDHSGDGIQLTGDSTPAILGSSIIRNLGSGLRVDLTAPPTAGNEVVVDHSTLFSNGGFGIDNLLAGDFDVLATSNYWGDDSGPFDNSDDTADGGLFNPGGQGQSVSDGVAYDPWVRIGPSQAGVLLVISGSGQIGTVGTVLPDPLVIEVQSTLGTPLEGIEVIFSIVAGDAQVVEPQPLLTDAVGRAAATVQLGMEPGEVLIAVTARDVDSPLATFMAETDDACVMSLTALPLEPTPGLGDVNGDQKVDNRDAALVQAVLDGVLSEDSPLLVSIEAADVNADGRVDRGDLQAIQSYIVGMVFWTPPA